MFWVRNKENNFQIRTLIWRPEIYVLGQHWIDGTDALKEGQWVWVSKMENIGFTAWKDGQPDNGNSEEHCLATNFATVGKWNDGNCILKQKYICETEIQS